MQDVTVDGTPIDEQSKSKIAADQAAGAVSLLIKIGHKVGIHEMRHALPAGHETTYVCLSCRLHVQKPHECQLTLHMYHTLCPMFAALCCM